MVYLIGAGPGDEGLITVRGLSLIRAADCILYDSLINPRLLDSAPAHCRKIYVGKRAGCHSLPQQKINRILVAQLRKYRVVVRLKGGDPFIFGRGAEETLYLAERGIEFEVVPGVSSATAVPAYAGIPLTHRDMASTVGFITGQEAKDKDFSAINWAALARGLDTMVFLMGLANLKTIIARLRSAGCPSGMPAAVITSGATSSQRTVSGTLEDILIRARRNKIVAPAIIVVGKVVGLRDRLSWFERRPLWGKRVVVTRAGHQAGALCLRLRELGAEVIEAPVIRIISLRADRQIKKALSSLNYRWVFFTSQNGVIEFAGFLRRVNKDARILGAAKIGAIGPRTAQALMAIGLRPDYVPAKFSSRQIVKEFKHRGDKGAGVLLLRARQATDILPRGLRKLGLRVDSVDLYDTVVETSSGDKLKAAFQGKVDVVTFTSSSTVDNFIKLLGRGYKSRLKGVALAAIGPVTAATLRRYGLRANIRAREYTIEGLVEAIERKMTKRKSTA